jgi:hypothetical protein
VPQNEELTMTRLPIPMPEGHDFRVFLRLPAGSSTYKPTMGPVSTRTPRAPMKLLHPANSAPHLSLSCWGDPTAAQHHVPGGTRYQCVQIHRGTEPADWRVFHGMGHGTRRLVRLRHTSGRSGQLDVSRRKSQVSVPATPVSFGGHPTCRLTLHAFTLAVTPPGGMK